MQIEHTIDINAPIEKVFRVFSDLDMMMKELPGVTKIEVLKGPALMEKGTKWAETREMFGREETVEMWVTDIQSNKSMVIEADANGAKYHTEYLFTDNGDKTTVKMTFAGTPYTFMAKMMSVFAFMMQGTTKKMLADDLEALKKVAEKV